MVEFLVVGKSVLAELKDFFRVVFVIVLERLTVDLVIGVLMFVLVQLRKRLATES